MTKLTIKSPKLPAVTITREAVKSDKLVYFAVANKAVVYPNGEKSRIVYIGTTQNGAHRMAASAAIKALDMLGMYGVKQLQFFSITCKSRQNVKTWRKLERGLLLTFKYLYGGVPKSNIQGKRMKWTDELAYFSRSRLESVVAQYSV